MKLRQIAGTAFMLTALSGMAHASSIERHSIPDSDFPILQAVTLENVELTYFSGTVPRAGEDGEFGDTESQTISVLERIKAAMERRGLDLGDVVKMTVFLVPTEETGRIDFSGFMDGYTQYFGTDEQPNLPTRSVVGVADLANPEWLVEIEVVAARTP